MGNTNSIPDTLEPRQNTSPSINQYSLIEVMGQGGFGEVWRAKRKKNFTQCAVKIMSKKKIIARKSVRAVMNERNFLEVLHHSFMVNMQSAFQDRQNLYLVLDLHTGGDLRYHLHRMKTFNEETTKFFAACIITALEYLHQNGVLHRDVKPENLIFDNLGYLRLTDLGIARIWKPENSTDTSGTPGYMAPEVMCGANHGVSVDYYALGVIIHECMLGRRPYQGKTRGEVRQHILAKQAQIRQSEIPKGWNKTAIDFVNKLIQRKAVHRLGVNGPQELKNHPWLADYPWDQLVVKDIIPTYVPSNSEKNYVDYSNAKINSDTINAIDLGKYESIYIILCR